MAMKKIIYLTREDYQTLYDGGSVIKDGVTYTYDYDAVYMVPKAAESGFVTLDTEQTITAPKHFTHAVETPLTIEFNNSTAYALRIEDTDTNSSWSIDADENAGEGYDIHLPAGSGTLALVSDIPSPSNFIQKAGDTGIGDLSFASGKKITFNGYNNTQLLLGCNSDSNGSFIRYAGPSALTISTTAADLTLSPQYNINLVTSVISKAYYNNREIATVNQLTDFVTLSTDQTINSIKNFLKDVNIGQPIAANGAVMQASKFSAKDKANYMTGVNIASGAQDTFYCANLKTDFWKHSARCGDHQFTEWQSGTLYDGQGASGLYFLLSDYPITDSTPLVIQICSGDDENGYRAVDHTDVMSCMLHTHTFQQNYYFLTKYKVEVLCKPGYDSTDPLPASELSWYTIINRSGVHDDVEGLTFRPDNQSVTGTGYVSFRGLRITIYGVETNDTYWRISEIQMLNQRGAGVPASAVGALPLSGGELYGEVKTNSLLPRFNGSYGLGSSSYRYNYAWINTIYENGTALSSKYLGKNDKAVNSDRLDNQSASYYLNYNNLTNKPAINNGQLTIQKNGSTIATFTANQSGNTTANISGILDDNSNIKESKIIQDSYNTSGNVNEYDRLLIDANSANRIAFISPNVVTVEYSQDSGTTWVDYGLTDDWKATLFGMTGNPFLKIGTNANTLPEFLTDSTKTKYLTRVTITQPGDNYCQASKFYCVKSNAHTANVKIEYALNGDHNTWITWRDTTDITGWSGPNMMTLNMQAIFGGNANQIWGIRLIFGYTSIDSSYATSPSTVGDFRIFGLTGWSTGCLSEKPYRWDVYANLLPRKNMTSKLGTSSDQWAEIHGVYLYENNTLLSNKYLGKTATAANSSKLNGQDASYYLNYNNLTNKPTIPSTDNFVQKSGDTMTGPLKLQDTNAQNISITAEYFNLGDETAPDWKHGIGISASNNLSQQVKFWTEYYASGNTLCADAGIYVTHNLTTEGMVRAVNGGWFDSDVRCDGKIALNNSNQKAISFDSYHKIAYETNGQLEFYALNGFLFATRNNSGTITDWNKLIPHGKHNNDLPQVAGTIAIEPHGWVTTAVYSKVITTGLKGESTTTVYTKGSKHKYVVDIIITDSETIQSVRKSMSLFGAVYKWEFTPLQLNNYIEDSLFTTINNCSRYNVLIDDAFLPNSNLGRFNGNGIKYDTFLDKGTTNVISIRLSYIEADEHNTGSLVTNGRHIQAEFYD